MLRIATVNVNGLRAAMRKGMRAWLEPREIDVLALQEVRAPDEIVTAEFGDWHRVHAEAEAKGRAGVALLSRHEPLAVRRGLNDEYFATSGRWVEMDLPQGFTAISAYVHSGEAGTPKQDDKYRFMGAVSRRLEALKAEGREVLLMGDINICHTERDLRNWKGNLKNSGFLPEERAWVGSLLAEQGLVDVQRQHAGDSDGPYSWWSYRGKAFDTDTGWRIDYHLASPEVAGRAASVMTDRAPSHAERWSDHAPVVADYRF